MKQPIIRPCLTLNSLLTDTSKRELGWRICQNLKGFFFERSPQERLCQVYRETYPFWRILLEIISCSLKHYSNISTFLSCFLIELGVFRECSRRPVLEISSVCQRSAYPRTLSSSFWSPVDVMVSKLSAEKLGHLVRPLTSFTAGV